MSWSLFFKRTLLRTVLVVLTCCIAIFIPFFGLLMELVGAMCLTMMVRRVCAVVLGTVLMY